MKKTTAFIGLVTGLCVLSSIPAFASGWQKDTVGWWYGTNENNTTWYNSGWQWVDGNNDGIAESYYFNSNGYIAVNTTVDGYTVNNDGAWTVNGIVQTKQVSLTDTKTSTSGDSTNQQTSDSNSVFTSGWYEDANGRYYSFSTEEQRSSYENVWMWIDADLDGVAECYYFGANSYIARNTTVDGWQVNENGAWVVDGVVQTHTNANGDEFDGMSVNKNDPDQIEWDLDGDGKLIGLEYGYYKSIKDMEGVHQLGIDKKSNIH